MSLKSGLTIAAGMFVLLAGFQCLAAEPAPAVREIPARTIPVPATVSPELQKAIEAPWIGADWKQPTSSAEWKASVKPVNEMMEKRLPALKEQLKVTVTPKTIAGVPVFVVKPEAIAKENARRKLVHLHGGAYVYLAGESAAFEAILMAHYGKIEVISVDYRMPPDYPFPAALDDAVAVWKDVVKSQNPKTVGLFGTSAGGGLTLATVLKLKELKLPLPGAIMAGTPWSDLSKTGDTYFANEVIDNVLNSADGRLLAAARLYAGKHDLKEPLLSPVYGDLSGFPPTVLLSGTRDLFLSNTVRVHQKLLEAKVPAELLVYEGQSHAHYMIVNDAPECAIAYRQVTRFFERNLSK